jgi:hypothetical protein
MHLPPTPGPAPTRRAFLRTALGLAGAGALGAVAGCGTLFGGELPPPPDELAGFIAATVALGDRYDAVIKALPDLANRLEPIRDAHRAHVTALTDAIGGPVPTPSVGGQPVAPRSAAQAAADLAEAERTARDEAIDACMAGSNRLAPLLGAIAAARASHAEVVAA